MGLVTEYPLWFVLFCILLAAVYAGALYYKAKAEIPRWLIYLLTVFRFISVFLISFLLLSPLVRQRIRTVEKPLVIIGTDNSQSVAMGKDSLFYRKEWNERLSSFVAGLEKKFEVRPITFGERIRDGVDTAFSDKMTNISDFFSEIDRRYAGRNVGAVVLASDGIFNQGFNPEYTARRIAWPVYTVVMGDTVENRDILIRKVTVNKQAFLGDLFPVEITVEALKCRGEKATIKITKGTQTITEIPLQVNADRYQRKFDIQIEAKEKGLQHYTVTVSPVDGEFTPVNNRRDFFIDVLDERQKILILYDAPHPDVAAIRQGLESGIRFEVHESELSRFSEDPGKYDLVILYQLPSVTGVTSMDRFMKSKGNLLFVLGTRSDLFAFNNLQAGLVITSQKASYSESQPALNKSFALFTVEKDLADAVADYPPLVCPFGTYQSSTLSDIFMFQKMGNVTSKYPMIVFFRNTDRKIGVIAGENIWRWRIENFISKGNHDAFNEMVGKVAMYLSVKGDKSFFRVNVKNTVMENEPVEFTAQVFNKSYEPVNDPDVSLVVKDEEGKSYPFQMTRAGNEYYLNAGVFPAGDYTWEASVSVGKDKYVKNGKFIVAPVNLEALSVVADRALLERIAAGHDGFATTPRDLDRLQKALLSREDIASVSHFSKRFSDLTGNVWLFLLIIALLGTEWAIRKRSGM